MLLIKDLYQSKTALRQNKQGAIQLFLMGKWITLTKYQCQKLGALKELTNRNLANIKLFSKFYATCKTNNKREEVRRRAKKKKL